MNALEIVILTLFIISTTVLFLTWAIYYKFRLSIKHPNKLFFSIVSIQVIVNLCIIITIIALGQVPIYSEAKGSREIITLKYLTRFFRILNTHYVFLMSIEIYLKLKKKLIFKHKIRIACCILYSWIASGIFTVFSRVTSDDFLPFYDVARLVYEVYILILVFFLSLLSITFQTKYYDLITSKKMYSLLIIIIVEIFIIFVQVLAGLLLEDHIYENEYVNYFSYLIHSCEGIVEFSILVFSKRFRGFIIKIFEKKKDSIRESSLSLNTLFIEDPSSFKFNTSSSGLFSDIFDHLTKNALVYLLIAISMRFSENEGKKMGKNQIFKFSHKNSELLYKETQFEFIKTINPKNFTVIDCYFDLFTKIRDKYSQFDIFESLKQVNNYNKLLNLISESGGRSNSVIFITSDNKLVIKTITKREFEFFTECLLVNYTDRIQNCAESRLVRIFALLFIPHLDQYVILMENVVQNKEACLLFDLKGSKAGRLVQGVNDPKNPPKNKVLKDVNFDLFDYKIQLLPSIKHELIQVCNKDFLLLKNSGIMDYSILLCIQEKYSESTQLNRFSFVDLNGFVITLAVIDIFQEYCLCKICEKAAKSIMNDPDQLSSTDPDSYYIRIANYLATIIH